jgi:hypothetical protein
MISAWNLVYEPGAGIIRFRTHRAPKVRAIDLKRFDFACSSPGKALDMNDEEADFADFTPEFNHTLLQGNFPLASKKLLRTAEEYPGKHTRCL